MSETLSVGPNPANVTMAVSFFITVPLCLRHITNIFWGLIFSFYRDHSGTTVRVKSLFRKDTQSSVAVLMGPKEWNQPPYV